MSATDKTFVDFSDPKCDAEALNGFNNENKNLITGSGQTPNKADNFQTAKAVANYSAKGDFYEEGGGSAADAYVLEASDLQKEITQYKDGMRIRFRVDAGHTNTGASTVNINAIGVKDIKIKTNALTAGLLTAGDIVEIVFDESADVFQLVISSWGSWVPSYGASGSMTYTSVTTFFAKYKINENICSYAIGSTGTTGGTADKELTFTPPIPLANDTHSTGCRTDDSGGSRQAGFAVASTGAGTIKVSKYDYSNYGLGATVRLFVSDAYEMA